MSGNKLSVVHDLESVLECDTIKDEQSAYTPAITPGIPQTSILDPEADPDDPLEKLRQSIAKRASVLSRSSHASAQAAGIVAPGQDVEIVRVEEAEDQDMADEPAVVVEDDEPEE